MFKVIAIRQFGIELELRTHEAVEAYLQGGESNRGPDGVRLKSCHPKNNLRDGSHQKNLMPFIISLKVQKAQRGYKDCF